MLDKLHAFYAKAEQRPLMRPGMHSALLISRLVSITLRKPAPPVVPSQSRISIALDVDGTLVYFVASPSTRRPSSCFLDRRRVALSPSSPPTSGRNLSPELPTVARFLSSTLLSPPRAEFPVHRCHPSQSSPATSFARAVSLAPPPLLFLRPHSGFRSVGLWGRKNE